MGSPVRREDVQDHVAEVDQHPPRIVLALAVMRPQPHPPQGPLGVVDDGRELGRRLRGADYEEVGEVRKVPHVEEHDVGGLFVGRGGDGGAGVLDGVQAGPPGAVLVQL